MKLTQIILEVKSLYRSSFESGNYALAAWSALKNRGFRPHTKMRVVRNFSIDIPEFKKFEDDVKLSNETTLLSVVTMALGREGGLASAKSQAIRKAQARQMELASSDTTTPFAVV